MSLQKYISSLYHNHKTFFVNLVINSIYLNIVSFFKLIIYQYILMKDKKQLVNDIFIMLFRIVIVWICYDMIY